MAGNTKYTTKQQAVMMQVQPPATPTSTPPLNHNIDLNKYKCTVTSVASPDSSGNFAPGTLLHVVKVELWTGLAGPHQWQDGFNASSQQSVQVDQVTAEEEEG